MARLINNTFCVGQTTVTDGRGGEKGKKNKEKRKRETEIREKDME
jgi:hypothetical protein